MNDLERNAVARDLLDCVRIVLEQATRVVTPGSAVMMRNALPLDSLVRLGITVYLSGGRESGEVRRKSGEGGPSAVASTWPGPGAVPPSVAAANPAGQKVRNPNDPPTEKQRAALLKFGVEPEQLPTTKGTASDLLEDLIAEANAARKAREKR